MSVEISSRNIQVFNPYRSPIAFLDLGIRSQNCLINAEIKTIDALQYTTLKQLLSIKNIGIKSVTEIIVALQSFNKKYKENE